MPSRFKGCFEKSLHQVLRSGWIGEPSAQRKNVGIVVLTYKRHSFFRHTDRRTHAADLVRRDRHTNAAAAHQDPTFCGTVRNSASNRSGIVRIIARFGRVGTEIVHLMPCRDQCIAELILKLKTAVVRSNGNVHGNPKFNSVAVSYAHAIRYEFLWQTLITQLSLAAAITAW